jgi:hypothetical protein
MYTLFISLFRLAIVGIDNYTSKEDNRTTLTIYRIY